MGAGKYPALFIIMAYAENLLFLRSERRFFWPAPVDTLFYLRL